MQFYLPYKEDYSPNIQVLFLYMFQIYLNIQNLKKITTVFGNTKKKNYLSKKIIKILKLKNIFIQVTIKNI